jgi:hypothetical protein
MAVLMGNSGIKDIDPRGTEYWGDLHKKRSLRAELADWRFDSHTGQIWGWFVLMCNVLSAVMFVLLEYCLEINYVSGEFDVATVPAGTGQPPGCMIRCVWNCSTRTRTA